MLLQQYKENNLLFSVNFLEQSSDANLWGYRGDLVLIEGGVADDKGHAKPPEAVIRGAVLLADEKIHMFVAALDRVADLPLLLDKYGADFAPDMRGMLFIVNLKDPLQLTLDGVHWVLIPLVQGVPWNEAMEELAMEKSDFKGQKPADKLVTLSTELASYRPRYPQVDMDSVLNCTTSAKREVWGAV